jgi:hypothetical protein
MGVHHANEDNRGDFCPIQTTIYPLWMRVVCRRENESVRPIKINRELPRAIAFQFVTPAWQIPHYIERLSCPEIVKTAPYQLCPVQVVSTRKAFAVIPLVLLIADWKQDLHCRRL